MRAVLVREFGSPETMVVETLPSPRPGPDEVLIEVHAAGVNFPDLLVMQGLYQVLPPRPFVPGKECAGVIRAVGDGVTAVKPGDRVLAWMEHGAFAEEIVAPERQCFVLPGRMTFEEATGFALTFQTAWFALVERARLVAWETVLVNGAAGGVGIAVVQIAKALGATVLAATSTPAKAGIALANGADLVIDTSVPNLRERLRDQVRAATDGRGADVIVDPVGGDLFDASLRALAWSGRLVVVGFAAGRIPEVKANYLLVRNIAVLGLQVSDYRERRPQAVRKAMDALFDLYRAGKLATHVSAVFPLERFAEAFAVIAGREATGKLVLRMRQAGADRE